MDSNCGDVLAGRQAFQRLLDRRISPSCPHFAHSFRQLIRNCSEVIVEKIGVYVEGHGGRGVPHNPKAVSTQPAAVAKMAILFEQLRKSIVMKPKLAAVREMTRPEKSWG